MSGTRRRRINRQGRKRLSPEVIASWHSADENALCAALDLRCWQSSPLPSEISVLGISEATADPHCKWDREVLALQRQLLEVAGWPRDAHHVYLENLRRAEEDHAYALEMIRHPERGGQGTNCDPISRRHRLEETEENVAYRQRLLAELDEKIQ